LNSYSFVHSWPRDTASTDDVFRFVCSTVLPGLFGHVPRSSLGPLRRRECSGPRPLPRGNRDHDGGSTATGRPRWGGHALQPGWKNVGQAPILIAADCNVFCAVYVPGAAPRLHGGLFGPCHWIQAPCPPPGTSIASAGRDAGLQSEERNLIQNCLDCTLACIRMAL
jgi:hypothetical protein